MCRILLEDCETFLRQRCLALEEFRGKSILVTGATGYIGSTFVRCLLYANRRLGLGLVIKALVRNVEKAAAQLGPSDESLQFVVGSLEEFPDIQGSVDYVVHAASQTASRMMVEEPVETLWSAIAGMRSVLELARAKRTTRVVYLSSMEMYGHPAKGDCVDERYDSRLSPLVVRNSYPIGKVACEGLCVAYAKEYGVPVVIARPAQTFGPGIARDDRRVYAQLARCAFSRQPFVMKSKGESERPCLYSVDAAVAIALLLLKGESGEAYNIANADTYGSVLEMAQMVGKRYGFDVRIDESGQDASCYPETFYLKLDTRKIRSLGWCPTCDLTNMFARMMEAMKETAHDTVAL